MMLPGGSRICQHLREFSHRHYIHDNYYKHHQAQGFGLGFRGSAGILELSCFIWKPPTNKHRRHPRLHQTVVSSSSLQSKPPRESSFLSDCLSPSKDECDVPPEGSSSVAGGIVALGKFDALHVGHRELAIEASKVGVPYLLSFVGMAEVLGWEPRAPVVAKCDRSRVLSSWAPYCGNVAPAEFQIEFSCVRHLTPRQFVEKLCNELEVCGVVAGKNYRFGYKAAGDAKELVKLCEEYGIRAHIIDSVMDRNQDPGNVYPMDSKERGQVSSTRVRHALAAGDMKYVSELLGRPHRLMMMLNDPKGSIITGNRWTVSAPKSCLLNLPPKDGLYENCSLIVANENPMTCRVFIDTSQIHLETEELSLRNCNGSQDFQLLGIEFGD